jgi:ribosomal protein S18 acetylase RimI-like enzyme
MLTDVHLSIREAISSDRQQLANLIHFEMHVHRHLDWKPPLDWVGSSPYLVAFQDGQLVAALACPPDPPHTAWIRLFGVHSSLRVTEVWNALWPAARQRLSRMGGMRRAAAIPLHAWFQELLKGSHFTLASQIVLLDWSSNRGNPLPVRLAPEFTLRPMRLDDLQAVETVDVAAFQGLWQNSETSLELAFRQSAFAAVIEQDGVIVAYQISTATPLGGHLARLAVLPQFQWHRLGSCLVADLLHHFYRSGAQKVTVNTQSDNLASLALYQKIGFRKTGEEYPVFEHPIEGG